VIEQPVQTQLYLTAPTLSAFDEAVMTAVLAEGVACLMLDVAGFAEAETDALERMMSVCDVAECPLVAGGDDAMALELAKRFALDGVHLSGPAKQIDWARKQIGTDRIVGYDAGASRHNAMTAAEGGADYVVLGPLDGIDPELPAWWQAVIEAPLVISSGDYEEFPAVFLEKIAGVADFAMVSQVFSDENPVEFVRKLNSELSAG